jgi:hypothetical protein
MFFSQCLSYFGTPYALPKLDMIGIPDFSDMGMENYGLITFQVLDLLFDKSSSTPAKQHEVYTMTHEVILLYLLLLFIVHEFKTYVLLPYLTYVWEKYIIL